MSAALLCLLALDYLPEYQDYIYPTPQARPSTNTSIRPARPSSPKTKTPRNMRREHKKQLGAIKTHVHIYRGIPDEAGKTRYDNKKYQEELTKLFEDLTSKFDSLSEECEKEEKKINQSRKMAELEQQHLAMAMALTQQPHPRWYGWRQVSLVTELKRSTEYQARIQSLNESEEALRKRIKREGEQHIKDFKTRCALLMKSHADLQTSTTNESISNDGKPEKLEVETIEDGGTETEKDLDTTLDVADDGCTA